MSGTDPNLASDELVLEGIVLTCETDGQPHLSPMGPIVDRGLTRFRLRPFRASHTLQNLRRTGGCVFHVIDDVELLARAAVGRLEQSPAVLPTPVTGGFILEECCRWFDLQVERIDDSHERVDISCRVINQGRQRDFLGWNRAKHAVLEAAILATRLGILSVEEIHSQLERLTVIVEKTAGHQERRAMHFLAQHIRTNLPHHSRKPS